MCHRCSGYYCIFHKVSFNIEKWKNLKNHIKEYLKTINTMQLATSNQDIPWCCNVYFTFDNDLNIFFISMPTRKHSEDIRSNAKVALCFCKEHHKPFNMPNRGIQASGVCTEIPHKHEDFEKLSKFYLNRHPNSEQFMDSHYVYKIVPDKIVLFDEVNYEENPWQTLDF
ncbi:MAG: pyridoxamine 5'-phosphate oxidase family protein [Bdellovibrionota bacterium]